MTKGPSRSSRIASQRADISSGSPTRLTGEPKSFAAVSRDLPNQPLLYRIGISWFGCFALISSVIYAAGERIQHRIPLESSFPSLQFQQH